MQEQIYLPVGGAIPGIPGNHGAGSYIVDWTERTITLMVLPIELDPSVEEESVEE